MSALGVPACGPTGSTNIQIPGFGPTPGFQCVELVERYLYVKFGWPGLRANGAQVVSAYAAGHGLSAVRNGTPGVPPRVGDAISFSTNSAFSDTGHTALVTGSSVNSDGNGSIQIMSENWSGTAAFTTLGVAGWNVAGISAAASHVAWLPVGPAQSPPPPASAPIQFRVDVNGDGKTDLVYVYPPGNAVVTFLATANGQFTEQPALTLPTGFDASHGTWTTGDVNGDSKTDLVYVYPPGNAVVTFLATTNGQFTEQPAFTLPTGFDASHGTWM